MKKKRWLIILPIVLLFLLLIIYIKTDVYYVYYISDNEVYKSSTVRKRTNIKEIESPTKEGYVFVGWYDEDNNLLTEKTIIDEDKIFYAKWGIISTGSEN